MNTMKVVIIGSGNIGTAIASVLGARQEVAVEMWDTDVSKVPNPKPFEQIIPEADAVFMCTPASALPKVISDITPFLKKDTVIVSLSKGLQQETGHTADMVYTQLLPVGQAFVLLAGPMLAAELKAGLPTRACAASVLPSATRTVQALFTGTCVAVEQTTEVTAVALSSVLKNVYAIAIGVADGLNVGQNAKGVLANQSMVEMRAILSALTAHNAVVDTLAGVGDFIATGFSQHSHNAEVGRQLAAGKKPTVFSEGLLSLQPLITRLPVTVLTTLPLLGALQKIVLQQESAAQVLDAWLRHDASMV